MSTLSVSISFEQIAIAVSRLEANDLRKLFQQLPTLRRMQERVKPTRSMVVSDVVDFLATHPDDSEILAYKISDVHQERLDELLQKNVDIGLTPEEDEALDDFFRADEIIGGLKARILKARANNFAI